MNYYERQTEGMMQFKLTTEEHNKLFPCRQKKWYQKHEYFINENRLYLLTFITIPAKIINTLILPIAIITVGYMEAKADCIRMWKAKELGGYLGDSAEKGSETYNEALKLIRA
jgi:hypothetical protein